MRFRDYFGKSLVASMLLGTTAILGIATNTSKTNIDYALQGTPTNVTYQDINASLRDRITNLYSRLEQSEDQREVKEGLPKRNKNRWQDNCFLASPLTFNSNYFNALKIAYFPGSETMRETPSIQLLYARKVSENERRAFGIKIKKPYEKITEMDFSRFVDEKLQERLKDQDSSNQTLKEEKELALKVLDSLMNTGTNIISRGFW